VSRVTSRNLEVRNLEHRIRSRAGSFARAVLTQNMTLNPKITYLRQQLTSLVSLRYFRTVGIAERHLSTGRANLAHTCHTDTTQQTAERMYTRDTATREGLRGWTKARRVHTVYFTYDGERRRTRGTPWSRSRERWHSQRERRAASRSLSFSLSVSLAPIASFSETVPRSFTLPLSLTSFSPSLPPSLSLSLFLSLFLSFLLLFIFLSRTRSISWSQ